MRVCYPVRHSGTYVSLARLTAERYLLPYSLDFACECCGPAEVTRTAPAVSLRKPVVVSALPGSLSNTAACRLGPHGSGTEVQSAFLGALRFNGITGPAERDLPFPLPERTSPISR